MVRCMGVCLVLLRDQLEKQLRRFRIHSLCQSIEQDQWGMGQRFHQLTDQIPESIAQLWQILRARIAMACHRQHQRHGAGILQKPCC